MAYASAVSAEGKEDNVKRTRSGFLEHRRRPCPLDSNDSVGNTVKLVCGGRDEDNNENKGACEA